MTGNQGNWGVMFIATGKKHILSAIRSAKSVRKHNPSLNIHLFSNRQECGIDLDTSGGLFTSLGDVEDPHTRSKVDYMCETPFERTVFLDNDTRVLGDLTPLFLLLDRFDIALSHANNRTSLPPLWRTKIPITFPQFNSGVIVFHNSEKVIQLFRDWKVFFYQAGFKINDQLTLRELLWLSDLRIATLPPEYNLSRFSLMLVWHKWEAQPRILHFHQFNKGLIWFIKHRIKVTLRRLGLMALPDLDALPESKENIDA